MKKHFYKIFTSLIGLSLLLIFGFLVFIYFKNSKIIRFISSFLIVGSYISWGLLEHRQNKNLTRKIVAEYFSAGLLALALLLFLIYYD